MLFEKIKAELDRRGWSAYKLAQEAELPLRTVQNYVSGSHGTVDRNIDAMLKALDLEVVRKHKGK